MGWCSGTTIFDAVAKALLTREHIDRKELLRTVAEALEDQDWDCQSDSDYWDHPLVHEIFSEMHPDWDLDE